MYRIGLEEIKAVEKVITEKQLFRADSTLEEVVHFEKEWAQKIGTQYSLCVNGGTSALVCGLVGMGIGPGDEVIVPAYTFMASALAVLAVGAIPVLAEIDDSRTIDPVDIERKISRHTKAIMPVHIMGLPCDMDRIKDIAEKHGLKIIEDSCQADGGSYKGKRLGSIGDAGAFSFNFYKIISAGEGGSLVTDSLEIYERAMIYHDGGVQFRKYSKNLGEDIFTGTQFRISEITGAILRVQLKRLDKILGDLRNAKKLLIKKLAPANGFQFVRSNDPEGDCGIILALSFESEEKARRFAAGEGVNGVVPIDTGRHVYRNWSPILNKRGAHHPALNPFNLPQNQDLNMNYSKDMCPETLDILKKTVYLNINPDWLGEQMEEYAQKCINSLNRAD